MAMPVAIAFMILLLQERHLGLRNGLSETQRIFTSSWWVGDDVSDWSSRSRMTPRDGLDGGFESAAGLGIAETTPRNTRARRNRLTGGSGDGLLLVRQWLPASFVRFIWFCLALFIGLMAYVMGEAYAEMYLRTLPHNNWETIVYVYSWVVTVHLLDALTGWILGGNEGERVGSYPLGWVFKL